MDVVLEDPNGVTLYKETRKQLDNIKMKSNLTGSYKLCFSNEFSTFSHKVIYMDVIICLFFFKKYYYEAKNKIFF